MKKNSLFIIILCFICFYSCKFPTSLDDKDNIAKENNSTRTGGYHRISGTSGIIGEWEYTLFVPGQLSEIPETREVLTFNEDGTFKKVCTYKFEGTKEFTGNFSLEADPSKICFYVVVKEYRAISKRLDGTIEYDRKYQGSSERYYVNNEYLSFEPGLFNY